MLKDIKYSIVIPVYNSTTSLKQLAQRISVVMNELQHSFELIFVDDGSRNPQTWIILQETQTQFSEVRIIRLSRNFGQHAATLCGIELASGKFVITMDDDLQHLPEAIPQLISKENHDVVIGSFAEKKHSPGRNFNSYLKGKLDEYVIGKPKGIQLTSFRLMNRVVADNIIKIHTPYPYIPGLLLYITKDIVNIPVKHEERVEGKTGYSIAKQIKLFSNLIINNSSILLKLIGLFGISVAFISFGVVIYFLIKKITYGIPVTGWTSLITAILGIGGLMLFSIGVIGEYLIRLVSGIEKRPMYIIKDDKGRKA